ncbi:MAG: hypothetical protein SOX17_01465 [Prevotella sp.]|nr:hypothetical protein [Prevotella sp.]MDD7605679.1 hypothetical protein [Prevotellaceae bacterium]MDY3247155.1 hypothetical protein [Prevotella sp.]
MITTFNHPHIVRIIDVLKENSAAYYVMENIAGDSLASLAAREGSPF